MTGLCLIKERPLQGPKILLLGEPGAGKTFQLTTLSSSTRLSTLFVEAEAGALSIGDLKVDSVRPRTFDDCRDIACAIGGPNPALPPSAAYSEAHYKTVVANPVLAGLAQYTTIFVDSLTEILRQCRAWAERQPESYNDRGKKDLRGTYGLVAREGIGLLQQIQHAREKTIVLTAILEKETSDLGVSSWRIQLEGQRTGRELPGIVDEVITLAPIDFGDGKPVRSFVCTAPNQFGFLAKDRSGKLDPIEEPNLQKLLNKLNPPATGD